VTLFFLQRKTHAQSGDEYTNLVVRAKADLDAGNLAKSLDESQSAIKLDPSRWQAYVAAAGALEQQKMFDAAVDDFTDALGKAPEDKRAAIKELLQKCMLEEPQAPPVQPRTMLVAPPPPPPLPTLGSRDIVVQIFDNDRLKIGKDDATWNTLSEQLERIFRLRAEKVAFIKPEDGVVFSRLTRAIQIMDRNIDHVLLLTSLQNGLLVTVPAKLDAYRDVSVVVGIAANADTYVGNQNIAPDQLTSMVRDRLSKPDFNGVFMKVDRGDTFGDVVKKMEQVRLAGADSVVILTDKTTGQVDKEFPNLLAITAPASSE
jgi:biopolymer transport protein ExbD